MSTAKALPVDSFKVEVRILGGPHSGESFTLEKLSFTVGRGAENDIILINDPKLSRNHIKISMRDSGLVVDNLSTRNPITYKDKSEHQVVIKPKDKIKIGDTELEFNWDANRFEKTQVVDNYTQLNLTQVTESTQQSAVSSHLHASPQMFPSSVANSLRPEAPPSLVPSSKQPPLNNIYKVSSGGLSPAPAPVPSNYNTNQALKPRSTKSTSSPYSYSANKKTPPLYLGIGGGLIILLIILIFSGGDKKPKKTSTLKDTNQISNELLKSNQQIEEHLRDKKLQQDGRMDRIFESAQSYYVKGFRDYRQGQYSRAIISFQAALSFDPSHVLSKKYLLQSIKKQSEVVQFNLDQAKRYKEKSNYRLCRASAQQVIVMALRKDQSDPLYKEGKKIFDECDILSKGRF